MHSERLVKFVARKKVVFVIVEGPSDDDALGVILNRLYDNSQVHIEIIHGDITADLNIQPGDIAIKLCGIVKSYAESMHFKQEDFQEIIHLVDMDGSFIPDSAIIYNPDAQKTVYSVNKIQTEKPERIRSRNSYKREVINRISTLKKVWGTIPYKVYYMSCNLDHVLYDKQNSTDEEKENNAYAFSKKYKDNIEGFLTFISDSDFSRTDGYKESWDYIKKEFHSLERNTNLGICFADIRRKREEDFIKN